MNDNTPVDRDSVRAAELAHREAMEFVDAAFLARRSGDLHEEREYNRQALEKERQAANAIHDCYDLEPSRSVLYRSAAALAFCCDELEEAKRLVACGLAGQAVPIEIEQELQDLGQDIERKLRNVPSEIEQILQDHKQDHKQDRERALHEADVPRDSPIQVLVDPEVPIQPPTGTVGPQPAHPRQELPTGLKQSFQTCKPDRGG